MTLNDGLMLYWMLSAIPFVPELNLDLRKKIIAQKIKLTPLKSNFEEKVRLFEQSCLTDSEKQFFMKQNKSEEEQTTFNELIVKVNKMMLDFQTDLLKESIDLNLDFTLTEEEFDNIINVIPKEVKINETTVTAQDYLVIMHNLFTH